MTFSNDGRLTPSNKVRVVSIKYLFFFFVIHFAEVYKDRWIDVKYHVNLDG